MAEKYVKESNMSWIILQPSEVYGFGSSDAINKLLSWIKKYKFIPVIGNGRYKLSPAFIDDIIPAMIKAIVNKELRNSTFILAGPEEMTFNSLLDRISSFLNVRRYKIFVPAFLVDLSLRIFLLFKKYFLCRDQIP
jgi:NADH dehydrogenase|tara:strand:- start:507 stop:914 length:408 start_codon:yes stop_codon:yes gene_type:complete